MELHYEHQTELLSKVEGLWAKFHALPADNQNRFRINNFLTRLTTYNEQFERKHDAIVKKKPPPSDDYFANKVHTKFEDAYWETKSKFDELLAKIDPSPYTDDDARSYVSNESYSRRPQMRTNLPPINIEPFSGKQEDWENFRDLYRAVIHHDESMNGATQFYYLKSLVRGQALELIKDFPLTTLNYTNAWDALCSHYENARRLTHKNVHELLNVKPITAVSSAALAKLLKDVLGPIDALKKLDRTTDNILDDILVYLLSHNLDAATKTDWQNSLGSQTEPPTLKKIRTFILERQASLECSEYEDNPKSTKSEASKVKPKSQVSHLNEKVSERPKSQFAIKCALCGQEHTLRQCPDFKSKDVQDRITFIVQNKRCLNCFGKHATKICKSPHNCFTCHLRHHTLLHRQSQESPLQTRSDENGAKPKVFKAKSSSTADIKSADPKVSNSRSLLNKEGCAENRSLIDDKCSDYTTDPVSAQGIRHTHSTLISRGVLLPSAIIRVQGPKGITVQVRALIDPCSQASFVSESLCQRLQLKTTRSSASIEGTGGVKLVNTRKSTKVLIKPHFESTFSTQVEALVLSKVSSYIPPTTTGSYYLSHLQGLTLADPNFMDPTNIDMLLSTAVYAEILMGTVIHGQKNEPIAVESSLGWLVLGTVSHDQFMSKSFTSLHVCNDCDLDRTLQQFWKVESIPCESLLTVEEIQFEEHFNQTVSRKPEGRYVLSLPFKENPSFSSSDDPSCLVSFFSKNSKNLVVPSKTSKNERPDLRSSFYAAEKMLIRMENRFKTDSKLRELYHAFIREYIDNGHMTKLPQVLPSQNQYFIPHHAVWKEKSTSTKLRTVFNASSKVKNGLSLNDLLLIGPNLLPNLIDLLLTWQTYRYVFVADIAKMFRQMEIHSSDRQYQRILWRFSPSDQIEIYELNTVTYGVASSPCHANMTIKRLAKDYLIEHPLGSAVLNSEIYMDDVLSGGHSINEALQKQTDCTKLLAKGCFPLRKYLSNHQDILANVPQEFLEAKSKALTDEFAVLGISWNPSSDLFSFNAFHFDEAKRLTRRIILSRTAKFFDPIGWISPVIIQAKIIMQHVWREKGSWDDLVSTENAKAWLKWESNIHQLDGLSIPRWNQFTPDAAIIELHGFADASKLAYGAALYLRVIQNDTTAVNLVIAKGKVAPLSLLSIPRLELCAATLLAELAKSYLRITRMAITSSHLWSDSTDVLQWLKSHPSRWKQFVAHRCVKINDAMPEASWHYVKSKENPADIVSRGCSPKDLAASKLWWHGPEWLVHSTEPWESKSDYPTTMKPTPIEESVDKSRTVHLTIPKTYPLEVIHKISSYPKLLRIISYCLRFVEKLLNRLINFRRNSNCATEVHLFSLSFFSRNNDQVLSFIRPFELRRSRDLLVYMHQTMHFSEVRLCLSRNEPLNRYPKVLKLNPFLEGNLLRVGGRLANAQLPHDNRHPLLLWPDDVLVSSIARQTHLDTFHGGVNLSLGTIRLQFWIIRGRNLIKSVISRCHKCRMYSKRTCTQLMGNLPEDRINPSVAFSVSGVDYAGPIKVRLAKTRGNVTQKGYIAIFVCFVTRAIHIEVVEDYSTEAFIAAFHRFVSRRGHCSTLHSDQGTNFIGADSELTQMFQGAIEWSNEVQIKLSGLGTEWFFNPPGAPHFGGLWESAVKSMKYHLRRMIGEQALTFIEYSTLFCRIESILNSRPLLPLSDDITDIEPLTPSLLVSQRSSYFIPEPNLREKSISVNKRYEMISQLTQHFWDRWSTEYLTSLQPRVKWNVRRDNLQIGDLVKIKNEITPPGTWPLGLIAQVHPGKDGLVRTVTVRTASSEFRRPIAKIVLLERVSE